MVCIQPHVPHPCPRVDWRVDPRLHGHGNAHTYAYERTHGYDYADSNGHAVTYGHDYPHPDSYAYAYAYPHTDTHGNADRHGYTYADPCAGTVGRRAGDHCRPARRSTLQCAGCRYSRTAGPRPFRP